jgi:hypothetical protein
VTAAGVAVDPARPPDARNGWKADLLDERGHADPSRRTRSQTTKVHEGSKLENLFEKLRGAFLEALFGLR